MKHRPRCGLQIRPRWLFLRKLHLATMKDNSELKRPIHLMYKLFFPSSVFTCLFTQPSWQSASFLPAIFTPLCTMCRLTEGGRERVKWGWLVSRGEVRRPIRRCDRRARGRGADEGRTHPCAAGGQARAGRPIAVAHLTQCVMHREGVHCGRGSSASSSSGQS